MTATIVRLLPADEQALLKCYVKGTSEPDDFGALYDALEYRQMPRHRDLLLPLRKSFYITFKERFRSGRQ